MAQADDDITTLIWLAEAEAMIPSTPKRVLCPLLSEAIATKKLRWDGPPGWRRPDYIDFDNPKFGAVRAGTYPKAWSVWKFNATLGAASTFTFGLRKRASCS